jgi:NADH-quinone oxidoreductase subunit N
VGITLEFFFAFFFVFFSSLLLLQSNNLIVFYILIEIQSIVLYFLIAFDRASSISAESGLKYFLTSIFMSIIFLLGISFIYITFGTTNLSLLSLMLYRLVDIGLSLYGFIFIFIFIFFKLAVVPFHFWALEVYEGASWPVISILAVISKLPLIIFLIKFFVVVSFDINLNVNLLLILINIFGIFSIIVGTFGAVYYMNIRKILVYSGITNIGYVLLALGSSSLLSIIFVYIYFIFYMFVVLLLVSFILLIFGVKFKDYTFQFKGLAIKYSYIALLFLLLFFILVGLPPFAGFWTKFLLIYSMLITGSLFKALFVFISNILSAVYYLRIVKEMYFGKDNLVIISLNFKHYLDNFYLFLFIFILFFLCLIMLNFDLFIWIILYLFI